MELKVDCFKCGNRQILSSPERLGDLLLEIARKGKMTVFSGPHIVECPFPAPGGGIALSGVLFLGESSITVHTYPEFDTVFLDIFHCLPFDINYVFWLVVDRFEMDLSRVDTYSFSRGIGEDGTPIRTRLLREWKQVDRIPVEV
jgi:S-adenosylmethionine/arginine decarboxylase-like enzyme